MNSRTQSAQSPYPSMSLLFDAVADSARLPVLEAAIELDIPAALDDFYSAEEVAATIAPQADVVALTAFLDAMTALGLAEKKQGRYCNTAFSSHFLRRESPVFLGGLLEHMKIMQNKNLGRICTLIRQGAPELSQGEKLQSEARWQQAVAHLAVYQRAGMAEICADLVAELPEFSGMKKILDLGGGPGIIGSRILKRLPGSQGVLVDLPGIIQEARKILAEEEMTERIHCIAGDYNEIDFGSGYDLIWASHNLYYVRNRPAFFQRVKAALNSGGLLVCLHEGLKDERTSPPQIVLGRLSLALEGQNVSFAQGEIAQCLEQAGFARIQSELLSLPSGQAELVVARVL